MEFVSDIKRSYRRYKLYNKAAHPVAIWLIEAGFLLLRILILLAFLAIIYLLLRTTPLGPFGKLFGDGATRAPVTAETADNAVQTPDTAIVAARTQPTVKPVAPATARASSRSVAGAEILGPGWLLEQNVGDYTIQFASAADMSRLVEFADQFSAADAVTIYPFQRKDGQIIYGLASGIYADFASARQAIEQLPEALRKDQPWIRGIDSLQTEISAFRSQ